MHTISISVAKKQFNGPVAVGQYVAFWMSDDMQDSMEMTSGSSVTQEDAIAEAKACCIESGAIGGECVASLVVADE